MASYKHVRLLENTLMMENCTNVFFEDSETIEKRPGCPSNCRRMLRLQRQGCWSRQCRLSTLSLRSICHCGCIFNVNFLIDRPFRLQRTLQDKKDDSNRTHSNPMRFDFFFKRKVFYHVDPTRMSKRLGFAWCVSKQCSAYCQLNLFPDLSSWTCEYSFKVGLMQ